MKKSFKITLVAAFAIFSLFSCGKKDSKDIETVATPTTEETYEENPIETPVATNDLQIESNDQMQYSVTELRAPAGKITLTLKHVCKIEKIAMGHN